MTIPNAPKNTTAFYAQAAIAFGLSLVAMLFGIWYLPAPGWTRAFLALGTLFLTSSCFTLAKCVRDQQESGTVLNRLDQARLERLLAEVDPFGVPHLAKAFANNPPAPDGPPQGYPVHDYPAQDPNLMVP